MKNIISLFCITVFAVSAAAEIPEVVAVTGGKIQGTTDNGVRSFKGVYYADTTAGDNRWRAPQTVKAWKGVRDAKEYGLDCPQAAYAEGSMYYRDPRPQSEDCLSLNIWTAANSASERRPVMVWIHGGALTRGSGATATYNGANLAKKGVVLVTINYRLNVFGYLAHPELTAESKHRSSGNYGVLDQVAALQWVRANIATFGGDSGNVTIFGESAGSWSVCALQATPLSKGLFHRVIGESGGVFSATPHLADKNLGQESQETVGVAFGEALGDSSLAAMRAVSFEDILAAQTGAGRRFRTRAAVDGWAFPQEVREIFAQGKQHNVPVMIGSNAKEMTTLTSPASVPKDLDTWREGVTKTYGPLAQELLATYSASTDAEVPNAWLAVARDSAFTWQMRTWARMMANVPSDAYLYFFSRVPELPNKEYLGAFHASEIAYAFNNVVPNEQRYSQKDVEVASYVSEYWVNFAKTGDPNGAGLPAWKPYTVKAEPYMELGDAPKPGNNLLKTEVDFMEKVKAAELLAGGQ